MNEHHFDQEREWNAEAAAAGVEQPPSAPKPYTDRDRAEALLKDATRYRAERNELRANFYKVRDNLAIARAENEILLAAVQAIARLHLTEAYEALNIADNALDNVRKGGSL